nr:uncharacterized protein LOC117275615 [Nicotiana tomentosiformis]
MKPFVLIGSHKQQILYEGDKLLCKNCGHLGHSTGQCTNSRQQSTNQVTKEKGDKEHGGLIQDRPSNENGEWKTVTFHKGKKKTPKNEISEAAQAAGTPGRAATGDKV